MKRSKLLLVSGILSTIYLVYLINRFLGGIFRSEDLASILGSGIASILIMPHILALVIGVIFNWIGWIAKLKWTALVSGIMYAIAMVTMFIYSPFVVVQMIFCFIAFSKMKNPSEISNTNI